METPDDSPERTELRRVHPADHGSLLGTQEEHGRRLPGSQGRRAAVCFRGCGQRLPEAGAVFTSYSPHSRSWPLRRKGTRPWAQAAASVTPRTARALLLTAEPAENKRPIGATSARAASLGPWERDALSLGSSPASSPAQRPPSWV